MHVNFSNYNFQDVNTPAHSKSKQDEWVLLCEFYCTTYNSNLHPTLIQICSIFCHLQQQDSHDHSHFDTLEANIRDQKIDRENFYQVTK